LKESAEFNYSMPRRDASGATFAIRRPIRLKPVASARSIWRIMWELVSAPLRLAQAVGAWLSMFSVMYTGKPLIRSGDALRREIDLHKLLVNNNIAEAHRGLARLGAETENTASSVPADWVLVKLAADGSEEILARRVIAFDILDGSLFYTDGSRIMAIAGGAPEKEICRGEDVEKVVVLSL
jgi:hypothetical protein